MSEDLGDTLAGPGSCASHGASDESPPPAAIPIAADMLEMHHLVTLRETAARFKETGSSLTFPAWYVLSMLNTIDGLAARIAATREPTQEMVSAGLDALERHFDGHDDGHMVRQIWRAMNDAAQSTI